MCLNGSDQTASCYLATSKSESERRGVQFLWDKMGGGRELANLSSSCIGKGLVLENVGRGVCSEGGKRGKRGKRGTGSQLHRWLSEWARSLVMNDRPYLIMLVLGRVRLSDHMI